MKPLLRWMPVVFSTMALGLAAHARKPVAAPSWTTDYRRYAAQKDLALEDAYSLRAPQAGEITMSGLLRALPDPAEWPQLRLNLSAAAARAPAGVEQQRLKAGTWLLGYLLGDRAGVAGDLPAATKPDTASGQAVAALRHSLAEGPELPPADSLEEAVDRFEEELAALEPLNLDDVKRALGGEENFARLQRLIEAGKAMQAKMAVVFDEYEKTKDKATAKKHMQALTTEFTQQHGADRDALAPYMEKPLVERYLTGLYRDGAAPDSDVPSVMIPDLVTSLGREEAEAQLLRALHLPAQLLLGEESGADTSRLAHELARAEIVSLKVPAWGLAQAVDQGALFEALLERFPSPGPGDADYETFREAGGYYLAGLIQRGRTADAVAFASRPGTGDNLHLPYAVMEALEKSGQAPALWEFLRDWLGNFPGSREWDRFNRLTAQLGRKEELKALVSAMAANGSFAGLDRLRVQEMQADAELATDDLAAAVTRLQAAVALPATGPEERASQFELAVKLLRLADLQADAAGFATALAAAEAREEDNWAQSPQGALTHSVKLVTTLNSLGRLADGYRLGGRVLARVAEIRRKAAADPATENPMSQLSLSEYELGNLLGEQLRAAVELGQRREARALVQDNPEWKARDAGELLRERVRSNDVPVGLYFAQVALQQKDARLARRILEAQLAETPGVDAVYAAYLGLAKKDARPLLEKLAAADRYEERPLIWQARLELDAKKWDEAVATLQRAISVDPSDGEQGRGDRMRVYAFMAEAMKAKGDAAKAKFFEDVVKSIRLSETADRWFETGAYAHAIDLYRRALGFFQDAYCIQSRLAVRLADEGKVDEAAEHYRRAFELMPDSFGRVESHCFGCEHVFAGEKTQGMAEQVFTTMLAARPDKPQLHYLMGYLRNQQERWAEAAQHFRRAVELDPLYLNAWDKLAGLESRLNFPPEQRDDLQLKLLELDPSRRHVSPDLGHVSDLVRLWQALVAADRLLDALPAPGPLWELKASAAALTRRKSEPGTGGTREREKDFAAIVLEHRFLGALQAYLASLNLPPEKEGESADPANPVISAY